MENHHLGYCCPRGGRTWAKKRSARANLIDFKVIPTVSSAKRDPHLNCLGKVLTLYRHPLNTHYVPHSVAASGAGRLSMCTHNPAPQGSEQKHHLGAKDGQWRNSLDQGPKQASSRQSQGQHSRPRELQSQGHMVQSLSEGPPGTSRAENGRSRGALRHLAV